MSLFLLLTVDIIGLKFYVLDLGLVLEIVVTGESCSHDCYLQNISDFVGQRREERNHTRNFVAGHEEFSFVNIYHVHRATHCRREHNVKRSSTLILIG